MKRKNGRRASGRRAEKAFFEAWKGVSNSWIAQVRRATRHQDLKEFTDAELVLTTGKIVPVQIKSGKIRGGRDFDWHFEKDVLLVHIDPHDSKEVIRRKTIEAIQKARERLASKTPPQSENNPNP